MAHLLSPITINGTLNLKNRFVLPPMCTYSATDNGCPAKFHEVHYGKFALGGTSLIIVEATAVESRGRISANDLGLWSDAQIKGHQILTDTCHTFDAKISVQLAHAGRKSNCAGAASVAPSAVAFSDQYPMPNALDDKGIETIKQSFVQAAIRAEQAGYDAIELHTAHGYLLFSFLSPVSNQRTDTYGGCFENRIRLLTEVIQSVKNAVSIPIWIRLSASEWMTKGWSIEDSIQLCQTLQEDISLIHVSAGGNVSQPNQMPDIKPLYQVPYAQAIKDKVTIPVIAVGLITTIEQGNALLANNQCDLVAYGRELTRNPHLPLFAAKSMGEEVLIIKPYRRSF